jgi:hypothetical protein
MAIAILLKPHCIGFDVDIDSALAAGADLEADVRFMPINDIQELNRAR